MPRRTIDVYYDVDRQRLCDATGAQALPPVLNYREHALLRLTLLHADLSAYTGFASDDTFSAAIDRDFDHDIDLMCKTLNADINVSGDWAAADPTAGKIAIRLDANTASFATALGTSERLTSTQFELQAIPAGQTYISAVVRFPIYCQNLIDDDGTVAPDIPGDYYTKTEADALIAAKQTAGAAISMDDAANIAIGTTTGTKLGTATNQKLGFWNKTPVVQPASANQADVSAPSAFGNADNEIGALTFSSDPTQAECQALRDKCEELADDCRALRETVATYKTLLSQIRADLVSVGIIKGAA